MIGDEKLVTLRRDTFQTGFRYSARVPQGMLGHRSQQPQSHSLDTASAKQRSHTCKLAVRKRLSIAATAVYHPEKAH